MSAIKFCMGLALCVVSSNAISSYPYAAVISDLGDSHARVSGVSQYGYRLVPANEYAVAEYHDTGLDIWDYIPSPVTVVKTVALKTWALTKWVVGKASFILLGAVLVLGICGLSPLCSISFDKYPIIQHGYRTILDSSALSHVEDFVYNAIDKFHNLQQAVTSS